jgi:hypothetical protein
VLQPDGSPASAAPLSGYTGEQWNEFVVSGSTSGDGRARIRVPVDGAYRFQAFWAGRFYWSDPCSVPSGCREVTLRTGKTASVDPNGHLAQICINGGCFSMMTGVDLAPGAYSLSSPDSVGDDGSASLGQLTVGSDGLARPDAALLQNFNYDPSTGSLSAKVVPVTIEFDGYTGKLAFSGTGWFVGPSATRSLIPGRWYDLRALGTLSSNSDSASLSPGRHGFGVTADGSSVRLDAETSRHFKPLTPGRSATLKVASVVFELYGYLGKVNVDEVKELDVVTNEASLLVARRYAVNTPWAYSAESFSSNLGSVDHALIVNDDGNAWLEGAQASFHSESNKFTARIAQIDIVRNDYAGQICVGQIVCSEPSEPIKRVNLLAGRRYEVPGSGLLPPTGTMVAVPEWGPTVPTFVTLDGQRIDFTGPEFLALIDRGPDWSEDNEKFLKALGWVANVFEFIGPGKELLSFLFGVKFTPDPLTGETVRGIVLNVLRDEKLATAKGHANAFFDNFETARNFAEILATTAKDRGQSLNQYLETANGERELLLMRLHDAITSGRLVFEELQYFLRTPSKAASSEESRRAAEATPTYILVGAGVAAIHKLLATAVPSSSPVEQDAIDRLLRENVQSLFMAAGAFDMYAWPRNEAPSASNVFYSPDGTWNYQSRPLYDFIYPASTCGGNFSGTPCNFVGPPVGYCTYQQNPLVNLALETLQKSLDTLRADNPEDGIVQVSRAYRYSPHTDPNLPWSKPQFPTDLLAWIHHVRCATPEPQTPAPFPVMVQVPPPQCMANQIIVNSNCVTCPLGVVSGTNRCQCASNESQQPNGLCQPCGVNEIGVGSQCTCAAGYTRLYGKCRHADQCHCEALAQACSQPGHPGVNCAALYQSCTNICGL